jgi:hypothetical protein
MKNLTIAGLFAFGALLFFGCNPVDNAVDCHAICDRYQTCFNAEYDVAACESRCREDANADNDDYTTRADGCSNCIDDKSCASATFTCAPACAGIVP